MERLENSQILFIKFCVSSLKCVNSDKKKYDKLYIISTYSSWNYHIDYK